VNKLELETLKKLIKKHMVAHSELVSKIEVAKRYYKNKNDILFAPVKEEETENPLRNADNRISSKFHGLLVNQKASYLFSAPPLYDVKNDASNKQITDILGDDYSRTCKNLCINAANAGIGWLHYWIDEEKKFQYAEVDTEQIIPIWNKSLKKKLTGVLRAYEELADDGILYDIYEYWNDKECQAYRKQTSDSDFETLEECYMFKTYIYDSDSTEESNIFTHDFGTVPFIPFANNNICTSDLDDVKPLIDVYDKVFSGFVNDLEDIQEIIFILINYEGESLGEFLSQLKKYKTVKIENNGDTDKSGLQTLTIDIPIEARKELLTITRKAIFEQGQGVDPQPDKLGDASGVALKYLYSLLELKAGLAETEFRSGFGDLVRAICKYLNISNVGSIIQTWTRTAIQNDKELAGICQESVGIISTETIVAHHPFVEDPQNEIKTMDEQKQKDIAAYSTPPKNTTGNNIDNTNDNSNNTDMTNVGGTNGQ
jgi:SPP1 family phage portal protein